MNIKNNSVLDKVTILLSNIDDLKSGKISNNDYLEAKNFFKENLHFFSVEQVKTILKDPYNCKNLSDDFPKNAIYYSIDKKVVFPIILKGWVSNSINFSLKEIYIRLINEHGNKEQIDYFCEHDKKSVDHFLSVSSVKPRPSGRGYKRETNCLCNLQLVY